MLRLSAGSSEQDVDIQVINGDGDGGIRFGAELRQFAEALASRDEAALNSARDALLTEAGATVLVDAAGVAANFQRMVRIADCTGIPLDDVMDALSGSIQDELDLRRFHSAANTPKRGPLHALKAVPLRFLVRRALNRASRKEP